ncbi:MAG TPA: Gfo/Idh/MocA family oxidoreductase [Opitutaceae bacterium]|nr:Gfo/Idh/MocA family oxidoreductase [Opitutaceae bacterium]HND63034.1 Gfo/Idh/MocA family oxidoreductase [Opitutaceae bacterium]
MKTRFAFIGFQHPHIWDLVARATAHPEVEVVACCEEDAATRAQLAANGKAKITHSDYRAMLATEQIDVVVVGEWFVKRGRVVIDALRSGRHVLADKPMCTTLAEYAEIEQLARERKLTVGMMLDMRDSGVFRQVRELVRAGEIGELRAASLGGQHPLLPGVRAQWYHEAGKHGGTINDIAVHGIDLLPWVTGIDYRRVVAARTWQAGPPPGSNFQNAGQFMLELANGAGVIADVSYLAPNSHGYTLPLYWRLTLWGSLGVLEATLTAKEITLYKEGEKTARTVPIGTPNPGGYLEAFLAELKGRPHDGLKAPEIFRASYVTLKIQEAADRGLINTAL